MRVLYSFLCNRSFVLRIGEDLPALWYSPLLFSLYTRDLPFPTNKVFLALYADDTAIFCSSKANALAIKYVKAFIYIPETWFSKWIITTYQMQLRSSQEKEKREKLKLSLCRKHPSLMRLSKYLAFVIYKAIIRPIDIYASVSWSYCSTFHINSLQIIQNNLFRMFKCAHWFLRNS
jgi:hypothetical protein